MSGPAAYVGAGARRWKTEADPSRAPLIAHARGLNVDRERRLVLDALRWEGARTFADVARAVGSHVRARYAVLQLAGGGDVVIRTPGHLLGSSVLAPPIATTSSGVQAG